MTQKTLTDADLTQFTGTEHWYRHGLVRHVVYTDGVKYVADTGGAYWLIDEIALAREFDDRLATEPLQVWTLAVSENSSAKLTCDDGNLLPAGDEANPLHRFSDAGDPVLFRRQYDPAAERILARSNRLPIQTVHRRRRATSDRRPARH
jgi:hypothetical protein